jgi:hypothetical protein
MRYLLLILTAFLFIACESDDPVKPDPSVLDGEWTASYIAPNPVYGNFDTLDYYINIVVYDGDITGAGDVLFIDYQTAGVNNSKRVENERKGKIIGEVDGNEIEFYFEEDKMYHFEGIVNNESTAITGFVKADENSENEIELTFKR